MKLKHILIVTAIILFGGITYAQEDTFMTGLLPDDGTYDLLERKKDLLTRDYTILPSRYSLLPYCPMVKSQSRYSTCTSWATAYAARTITEAVKYGWTNKEQITNEAFSPLFVYALIKDKTYSYDENCQQGTSIYKALQLMKDKGVPKFSSFDALCASYVNNSLFQEAKLFRIDDFFTLFSITCVDAGEKIRKVKKALSEDCPVVIAMHIPQSFYSAHQTWSGQDVDPSRHGYHAMCVIGYDDTMQGGAFQIMNSWGTNWGENGFVWVKYNQFAKYVDQAYEIYVRKETIRRDSEPEKSNSLKGQIELKLSTGESMPGLLQAKEGLNSYKLTDSYISGTRYRIYVSNQQPAYVYIIGSDLTSSISKVFPPTEQISAALTYKSSNIAIPDERYYIEMDNTIGTDYMCVLYSKNALDINALIAKMTYVQGSFYTRVKAALGDKMIPREDMRCAKNNISFQAQSNQTVVPIIVEIPHR